MSDWLDRPLVEITRDVCNKRHTKIGERAAPTWRTASCGCLRAIWRRARRQHPELPEPPTIECRLLPGARPHRRHHRLARMVERHPADREPGAARLLHLAGVLRMPGRRDHDAWRSKNIDLENGVVKYPVTKTKAFEMPLSNFMVELLRNRIAENAGEFGADCRWVFPSVTAASGHLEEEKLTAAEAKLFKQTLVAAHVAAFMDHHRRPEGQDLRQPPARADQPQAEARQEGDAHAGYIHPDLDDLRHSQQAMTDYLLAQIKPKPGKGKRVATSCRSRSISRSANVLLFPLAHSRRHDILLTSKLSARGLTALRPVRETAKTRRARGRRKHKQETANRNQSHAQRFTRARWRLTVCLRRRRSQTEYERHADRNSHHCQQ